MSRNKYNVGDKSRRTVYGISFDSIAEMEDYLILKDMEKKGEISDLRTQVKYMLTPDFTDTLGEKHRKIEYVADFVFFDKREGYKRTRIVDTKGYKTDMYRLKKKLFAWFLAKYSLTIEEKI